LYGINGSTNDRVFNHIYINNCYIHDVDGNEHGVSSDPYKSSGGIVGEVIVDTKGSVAKARFNDLKITYNTINHVDRTGIKPVRYKLLYVPVQTGGQYDSEVGPLLRDNNLWSTNVYIGHNKLSDIGGDGVLIRDTKGALTEHNVLAGFAMRSNKPNAGMWLWNAVDTTFQFNESITINMNDSYDINKFVYTPRQDISGDGRFNGIITKYNLYVSLDGSQYTKVAEGDWARDKTDKVVTFNSVTANYVKLEALEGSGGWATAAEINVYKSPSISAEPTTTLSGAASVEAGGNLSVIYGLKSVSQSVYAQDIQLSYDSSLLEFISAKSINEDAVGIIGEVQNLPGQLRFLLASKGADHAVSGDSELLELNFKAKNVAQAASGTIQVTHAVVGNQEGNESVVERTSLTVQVNPSNPGVSGDINQDGKVSIGDLAIIAANYGKTDASPDWEQIKAADVSGNGSIDLEDLAIVAKLLIE
jgi:hypothetical protein